MTTAPRRMRRWHWLLIVLAAGATGIGAGQVVANRHAPVVTVSPSAEADATVSGGSCGLERWDVKTGQDAAAAQVNLVPKASTIATLRSAPAAPQATSRLPAEQQVYALDATLTEYKQESDSDWHLVISDGSATMIVEIPDPACVGNSPWKDQIAATRAAFAQKYQPSAQGFRLVNVHIAVTGVLFFDHLHGQTGVAPNAVELHPVLSVSFP